MQAKAQDPARFAEVAERADQGDDEAKNEKGQQLEAKVADFGESRLFDTRLAEDGWEETMEVFLEGTKEAGVTPRSRKDWKARPSQSA